MTEQVERKITGECPKCKSVLEFNFAGCNGYVGMCEKCQVLHYYCALFGKTTVFKPTGESLPMDLDYGYGKN